MLVPDVGVPELPCQLIVQPPDWLPMLSALLPATKILLLSRASGRTLLAFFRMTWDCATAWRASAQCAALPTVDVYVRSAIGFSKRPNSNFLVRIRLTASSMRD